MKYIDADKLKAEIENIKSTLCICDNDYQMAIDGWQMEAYNKVITILDTLSKEPDTPEFPETFEICLYEGRTPDKEKCAECSTTCSVRKEEPDKSLEEEIDRFEDWMETYNQSDYPTSFTTRDIARHFAEWQKSQMLKDAVEGEVMTNGFYPYEPRIVASYPNCPYAIGDNVRIVVLKAEEE